MDYVAYFDFGDGSGEQGPYPLTSATPDLRLCSDSFHHAVSQYRISFLATPEYLALRVPMTGDLLVRILIDGVLEFKGLVPPTDSWTSNGTTLDGSADLSDIEMEVLDYSSWLERQVQAADTIAWEDHCLCNPAAPELSIVHRLLALCGLSGALFSAVAVDATVLHAFALDEGRDIGAALDDLLWQYGLVLHWDVDHFETFRWMILDPEPTVDMDEDILLTDLKTERIEREADAVEVKWYALKDKSNCLVYMADLPFGSDNQRSGYPIQPGLLWPEEANVGETWWAYEDAALSTKVDAASKSSKNTDFTQIVLTKNHQIDEKVDPGILPAFAFVFENKRARVAYSNPTAAGLNIFYSDIFADVIYRGAENSVLKNIADTPRKPKTVPAEFIHDEPNAIRLACALASQYGTACWRHTARSETLLERGTVATLRDPYSGLTTIVIIVGRAFDPETGIYIYRVISLSPVTIDPTATYQAVLPDPQTADEDPRQQLQRTSATMIGTDAYRNNLPPSNNVTNLVLSVEANADGSVNVIPEWDFDPEGIVKADGFLLYYKSTPSIPEPIDYGLDENEFVAADGTTTHYRKPLAGLSVRYGGAGAVTRHYRFAVVAVGTRSGGTIPHNSGVIENTDAVPPPGAGTWIDAQFAPQISTAEGDTTLNMEGQSLVWRAAATGAEKARIRYDSFVSMLEIAKLAALVRLRGTWSFGAWPAISQASADSGDGVCVSLSPTSVLVVYSPHSVGGLRERVYAGGVMGVDTPVTTGPSVGYWWMSAVLLPDGRVLLACVSTGQNYLYALIRGTNGVWSAPVLVDPVYTWSTSLCLMADGSVVCTYSGPGSGVDYPIRQKVRGPSGAWDAAGVYTTVVAANAIYPSSMSLVDGTIMMTYYDSVATLWKIITRSAGGVWGASASAGFPGSPSYPHLGYLPDGRIAVVYMDNGTGKDVYYSIFTAPSTWSAQSLIGTMSSIAGSNPSFACFGSNLFVLWTHLIADVLEYKINPGTTGAVGIADTYEPVGMGVVERGINVGGKEYATLGDGTVLFLEILKAPLGTGWAPVLAAAYSVAPPVGFVYIQGPGDSSPATLWPAATWANVSSEEAGAFRRTEGGNAAAYGSAMQGQDVQPHTHTIGMNNSANSGIFKGPPIYAGSATINGIGATGSYGTLETRPNNNTVRKWRRTA